MKSGERIRACRQLAKMTQQQLGEQIGLAANTISDIERGKYSLDSDLLEPLAKALNTTPAHLLGWNREPDELDKEVLKIYPDFVPGKNFLPTIDNATPHWGTPILTAYKDADESTQQATCNVLRIPHVKAPVATDYIETLAAHSDGLTADETEKAATEAIKRLREEREKKR